MPLYLLLLSWHHVSQVGEYNASVCEQREACGTEVCAAGGCGPLADGKCYRDTRSDPW